MIKALRKAAQEAEWCGTDYVKVDKVIFDDLIIVLENVFNGEQNNKLASAGGGSGSRSPQESNERT